MTLAEIIFEISRQHLRDGGLIMGQNLEAQQNVAGTVSVGEPGVTILPTSETAMAGVAIGAALSGKPVIYIMRFSSFSWFQAGLLVNYAAMAKELWGYDIPLFVRILCMDAGGPTHTGSMASIFAHRPGLVVAAPIGANEYRHVWELFKVARQPFIASEHRATYSNEKQEQRYFYVTGQSALIIAISNARFAALEAMAVLAKEKIDVGFAGLTFLNPLELNLDWDDIVDSALITKRVVITDCAFELCSIAEHIAYRIASETGARVRVVGMEPRLSGVASRLENGTPLVERITRAVKELLE